MRAKSSTPYSQYQSKFLLVVAFTGTLALCPRTLVADPTYVSGSISDATTWGLVGSPYILTESVNVHCSGTFCSASVLTILPGVVVEFNGYAMTFGNRAWSSSYNQYVYYPGVLVANDVTFTGPGSISLRSGSGNHVSGGTFNDVSLSVGYYGASGTMTNLDMVDAGLTLSGGTWTINGGTIQGGADYRRRQHGKHNWALGAERRCRGHRIQFRNNESQRMRNRRNRSIRRVVDECERRYREQYDSRIPVSVPIPRWCADTSRQHNFRLLEPSRSNGWRHDLHAHDLVH
jgi:hypothetical protein